MELTIFFDRVDEQLYENIFDGSSIFHNISIYKSQFPEWRSAQIAILGLEEERGNLTNKGAAQAADSIRHHFYKLKKGNSNVKIADLGNLRIGATLQDTYLRLKEVCEVLIDNGLFVILLGGTHDLDIGQYLAYEKFDKLVSIVCVDALSDLRDELGSGPAFNHLLDIISHEPNYLFHLCHLGSQSFLNDVAGQEAMEKLHFENVRLGLLRENIQDMEPLIRQADMLSFDIGAIKKSDAPGNSKANVFGLTSEEACQIAWYAGMNDKLSTAGIYEYNPTLDQGGQTAFVIATMVWYMIEGYCQRKEDLEFHDNRFMRYMVSMGKDVEQVIIFYKSKLSEKWWMEVPYSGKKGVVQNRMVPCRYADYELALKGEIPSRWLLMHGKLF